MKTQTKTACLILAFAAILSSCKKTETPKSNSDLPAKTVKLSAGDGLNDVLGYGYDVSGEYANSSAATYSVIDIDRLKAAEPARVEWDLSSKKYGEVIAGENALTYLSALTDKLGADLSVKDPNAAPSTDPKAAAIPLFKASIEGNFNNSDSFSSKYVYSSYALKIQQKRVKFNADIATLKRYLTPSFINDVNNSTPETIVRSYGTHVLKDIVLGAKLDIFYRSETTNSDRKRAATSGISFNILGIFGINSQQSSNSEEIKANTNQRLSFKAIGGEPSASLFGNIPLGSTLTTISTKEWENSSSLANAEMIDITEGGLIPIWDLIDDAGKSAAVKSYVIQYLKDKGITLQPVQVYGYLNSKSVDHYYTTEYKPDYGDWKYELIAFYAFPSQAPAAVPVYVYLNSKSVDHYYTTEYKPDYGDWKYEKIAFYAYTTQVAGSVPVYGYLNSKSVDHYYTTSYKPDYGDWKYEKIVFYTPTLN